ncbi:MAG: hypothetical protein ACI9OJ_003591, partial [Myxococcota bacterium]
MLGAREGCGLGVFKPTPYAQLVALATNRGAGSPPMLQVTV